MALTRKFLSALGIEAEKIDEIITAHTDTISGIKEEMNKYKADAEKLPQVQQELDNFKNGDDWQKKYEDEHKAFEDYKTEVDKREIVNSKKEAYKGLLLANKVDEKRIEAILKVTNFEEMKLGDDGKFENESMLSENIKSDWAGFITSTEDKGADVETPPNDGKSMTKEAFEKLPLNERMTYANAHPSEVSAFMK